MHSPRPGRSSAKSSAPPTCRSHPTSIRARRMRRTPTKPSGRLPSSVRRNRSRSTLQEDELKLYRLIWMRFVASQMMPAVFDQTTIDVAAHGKGRPRLYLPRHRFGLQIRRLPGGLRRRQGPEGRGGRGTQAQAACGHRGREAEVPFHRSASSTSPSRRRATTKRRWSRSSNPTASAGLPPTPPSSPPFRSAGTSRRRAGSSCPPSSAWW